ncbi:MAG: alpha,alpha-trehalose-phosphate synthase (UDP-forming) [Acidimicrobiia bacterium]
MIVVSHRGPYTFRRSDNGSFSATRGAGGVVSALGPLLLTPDSPHAAWVAAAIGPGDRAAAAEGVATAPGVDLRYLVLDERAHRLHYDVISNGLLWFLHHGLFDLPRRPRIDAHCYEAWDAYVAINHEFAEAALDAATDHPGPVLVQDYQLALVPGMIRAQRPDLAVAHFTHTPFCGPNSIRVLPDAWARELCSSMASAPAGFHADRWRDAFVASTRTALGPSVAPDTFVAPLGADVDALRAVRDSERARAAEVWVDEIKGDRTLIVRADRIELSKNIVRGFLAYDQLLDQRPEWRERVVFLAMLYTSRQGLPDYRAYEQEIRDVAARINERWGTSSWQPIVIDTRDDFARSVAALTRYDVLVVNPLKDGLNLVALEGVILNERNGVLCLSPEAGAWDLLSSAAIAMHPYDLVAASDALTTALDLDPDGRATRAQQLRYLALTRDPSKWLDELVAHAR